MGVMLSSTSIVNAPDELACMRGKSQGSRKAQQRRHGIYGAVVDGKVLKDSPIEVMQRGQHHHLPVLEGNVKDEMSVLGMEASAGIISEKDYKTAVEDQFGDAAADLLRLYPASEYATPGQAYNALTADEDYVCPARRVLKALSASQKEFVGRFFYTHTYTGGPVAQFGASHGFELLFIFDTLSAAEFTPTAAERNLVKTFEDVWSGFAKTGIPPPSWKRYDGDKDNYVVFDTAMSEGDHLHAKQCDLWDSEN